MKLFIDKTKTMLAKLYGYDINEDRKECIHELAVFLKLNPKLVKELLPKGTTLSAEEWKERAEEYLKEPYLFYSSSKSYLFDLCYGNYWNIGTYVGMILIAKNSRGRVLDYGGGVGSQLIMTWDVGLRDLIYYDIKGILFDFAKYRFKRRGMNVKMIEASDTEDRLNGVYDTIYCKEVLEHVKDPLLHLERLDKHLARGGRLFLSYHFGKDESHPMHFNHSINIDEWLRRKGYKKRKIKLFYIIPASRLVVYIKTK